jgi:hypothetical protein
MSAAERKAVGARMRAYWAKRRAEKAGAKPKRKGGAVCGSAEGAGQANEGLLGREGDPESQRRWRRHPVQDCWPERRTFEQASWQDRTQADRKIDILFYSVATTDGFRSTITAHPTREFHSPSA